MKMIELLQCIENDKPVLRVIEHVGKKEYVLKEFSPEGAYTLEDAYLDAQLCVDEYDHADLRSF